MHWNIRKVVTVVASGGMIALAPALIAGGTQLALPVGAVALAQGNGGGHGNGHGGSHGSTRGMGNAGGVHGMGSMNSASHSHSGAEGQGIGGFVTGLLGITSHARSGSNHGRTSHNIVGYSRASLARQQYEALRGKNIPVPSEVAEVKDKNLHARLGWLNSLQRNYHAYLNAKDPKFAPFQEYVIASATAEADLDKAKAQLASAVNSYRSLTTYDTVTIDPNDIGAVESRISDLSAVDPSQLTSTELAAYNSELDTLNSIVAVSDQIAADNETLSSRKTAEEAALSAATNSDEVDPQVAGWVDTVLAGKINDVRASLDAQSQVIDTTTTAAVDTSD